jgi:hypothetical protein
MKRSMTEGCQSTASVSSRPIPSPNAPSLAQAHSSDRARDGLAGDSLVTTDRAKEATSEPTEVGR